MSKVRLNKDGTPDKRYGKKKAKTVKVETVVTKASEAIGVGEDKVIDGMVHTCVAETSPDCTISVAVAPEPAPQSAGSVSYIQDIIDSRQAPGVQISAEHQSAPSAAKAEARRMAIYKENTNGKDPNEPMCHDQRTQTGGHL